MNPEFNDTSSEITALRNQVFNLLIALIVVSGTLTLFLYRQASMSGKGIDAVNQQLANYNQAQPQIMKFVNDLGAYGMTHPDIRPLLNKYKIAVAPTQPLPPGTPQK